LVIKQVNGSYKNQLNVDNKSDHVKSRVRVFLLSVFAEISEEFLVHLLEDNAVDKISSYGKQVMQGRLLEVHHVPENGLANHLVIK
jgi:hypothetical protein